MKPAAMAVATPTPVDATAFASVPMDIPDVHDPTVSAFDAVENVKTGAVDEDDDDEFD